MTNVPGPVTVGIRQSFETVFPRGSSNCFHHTNLPYLERIAASIRIVCIWGSAQRLTLFRVVTKSPMKSLAQLEESSEEDVNTNIEECIIFHLHHLLFLFKLFQQPHPLK